MDDEYRRIYAEARNFKRGNVVVANNDEYGFRRGYEARIVNVRVKDSGVVFVDVDWLKGKTGREDSIRGKYFNLKKNQAKAYKRVRLVL